MGEGLVVLGQAHEDGWQAFKTDGSTLEKIVPFLGERLRHAKVNSWSNGWFVPEGENNIVIVYLPQYLEYIGIIVIVITFFALIRGSSAKFDFARR
jgi:hypothetical protein